MSCYEIFGKVSDASNGFSWEIVNYTDLKDKTLRSPKFLSPSNNGHWQLQLEPSREKDYLHVWLVCEVPGDEKIEVLFTCKLWSFSREAWTEMIPSHIKKIEFSKDERIYEFREFAKMDTILDYSAGYLRDEGCALRILCEIHDTSFTKCLDYYMRLSHEIYELDDKQVLRDVVFEVKKRKFDAHKAILAAQSSVFLQLFIDDSSGSETKIVIDDVDPDLFADFLQYFYTGECNYIHKWADELLMLADKYGVKKLKDACKAYLYVNLTTSNAISTLIVADAASAEDLKKKCMKYVMKDLRAVCEDDEDFESDRMPKHLYREMIARMMDVFKLD